MHSCYLPVANSSKTSGNGSASLRALHMDSLNIWAIIGFCLAGYSIVANDAIQTLGTFMSSNEKRPWWVLWLFAVSILTAVLLISYFTLDGDVSWGRLDAIPNAGKVTWMHCVPPLALLLLTRFGFPVSTTFLILTFFAPSRLDSMLIKSIVGYIVAFFVSFLAYRFLAAKLEEKFLGEATLPPKRAWVAVQWLTTGFLWSQWLIQDLANIYVYVGAKIGPGTLVLSLAALFVLHAYTFYVYGGEIQRIVTSKVNSRDIRSASLIDLQFAIVLLVFKEWSNMPMSTTWVFLGVLAGREIELATKMKLRSVQDTGRMLGLDLAKASAGLVVSVALALGLPPLVASIQSPQPVVSIQASARVSDQARPAQE